MEVEGKCTEKGEQLTCRDNNGNKMGRESKGAKRRGNESGQMREG